MSLRRKLEDMVHSSSHSLKSASLEVPQQYEIQSASASASPSPDLRNNLNIDVPQKNTGKKTSVVAPWETEEISDGLENCAPTQQTNSYVVQPWNDAED